MCRVDGDQSFVLRCFPASGSSDCKYQSYRCLRQPDLALNPARAILTAMDALTPKRRWFYPQPAWLIVLSLATTGFLFLSERGKWFAFNQHKGWTVLNAVASVAVVLAVVLLWWLAALVFRGRFQFSIRAMLVLVIAVALP